MEQQRRRVRAARRALDSYGLNFSYVFFLVFVLAGWFLAWESGDVSFDCSAAAEGPVTLDKSLHLRASPLIFLPTYAESLSLFLCKVFSQLYIWTMPSTMELCSQIRHCYNLNEKQRNTALSTSPGLPCYLRASPITLINKSPSKVCMFLLTAQLLSFCVASWTWKKTQLWYLGCQKIMIYSISCFLNYF